MYPTSVPLGVGSKPPLPFCADDLVATFRWLKNNSSRLDSHAFRDPTFKLPSPTPGSAICNLMGLEVLHKIYEQATTDKLRVGVAEAILSIFTRDPANYFITWAQPKKTLEMMLQTRAGPAVRECVFRILEHIVCTLKFVPIAELRAVSHALETLDAVGESSHLALNTVIKFVNFNKKYGDVWREVGMLDVLIRRLITRGNDLKEQHGATGGIAFSEPMPLPTPPPSLASSSGGARRIRSEELDESQLDEDFYYGDDPGAVAETAKAAVDRSAQGHVLLMECLALLLTENVENAEKFRSAGGTRVLYSMVPIAESRMHALRVVQQLVLDDSTHANEDLSTLLELMQASQPKSYAVKIDILKTCLRLFSLEPRSKSHFREVQGFVYVISSLVALGDGAAVADDAGATAVAGAAGAGAGAAAGTAGSTKDEGLRLELVQKIFETLTAALCDSPANKHAMMHEIRYDILADSLELSGLLANPASAKPTFHYLLNMACEVRDGTTLSPLVTPCRRHPLFKFWYNSGWRTYVSVKI